MPKDKFARLSLSPTEHEHPMVHPERLWVDPLLLLFFEFTGPEGTGLIPVHPEMVVTPFDVRRPITVEDRSHHTELVSGDRAI